MFRPRTERKRAEARQEGVQAKGICEILYRIVWRKRSNARRRRSIRIRLKTKKCFALGNSLLSYWIWVEDFRYHLFHQPIKIYRFTGVNW